MKRILLASLLALAGCNDMQDAQTEKTQYQTFQVEHVTLSIPVEMRAEELFEVRVSFNGEVSNLQAKLEGISMDMGIVPVFFQRDNDNKNTFATKVLLGACALPVMEWRLTMTWQEAGKPKFYQQSINVER
ncbi:MAG: hypothetical protein ACPGR2_00765 [Psychrobium sp.]